MMQGNLTFKQIRENRYLDPCIKAALFYIRTIQLGVKFFEKHHGNEGYKEIPTVWTVIGFTLNYLII